MATPRRRASSEESQRLLVSDSGPLIVFAIAGLLPTLRELRGPVLVPSAVLRECLARPAKPGVREIDEALQCGVLVETLVEAVDQAQSKRKGEKDLRASSNLGDGEIEVLSVCKSNNYIAVIDEVRARKVAKLMKIKVVGSGGLLLELKRAGLIVAIQPVLDVWARHDYFIAPAIRAELLRLAQEA
jgi:uncharacterized protein